MVPTEYTLFSGGAPGAESEFGRWADHYGLPQVNFTFDGHEVANGHGLVHLPAEELAKGDQALSAIARLIHRQYPEGEGFRHLLLSIWHQVHHGEAVYVVGRIQGDGTVTGGTGWGAEYAKQCNKPLFVFDQERDGWYRWQGGDWEPDPAPVISQARFTGTGTRFLESNGRDAIATLFERSFGRPTQPLRQATRPPPSLEE